MISMLLAAIGSSYLAGLWTFITIHDPSDRLPFDIFVLICAAMAIATNGVHLFRIMRGKWK